MVCAISGVFDKSKSKLLGKSSLTFSIVKTELLNLLDTPRLLYISLKIASPCKLFSLYDDILIFAPTELRDTIL